jgi:ELWxxDGT repeat protein
MTSRNRIRNHRNTWFDRHLWDAWKQWRSAGSAAHRPSRRSVALRAEALEDRLLPSLMPPQLVLDINPGNLNSNPKFFTQVNSNLVFFSADDGTHGTELWASTAAGTFLVLDINPGTSGSNPKLLTNVNGTLFFQANDGTHGVELWESNGTAAGTFLVKDIDPGSNGGYPSALTNVNGTLFFSANDSTHGAELWRSDGTAAGTFMVQDINPGASGSYPEFMANVNGTLFFNATDGTHGTELFRSDGTAAGTSMVEDILPGPNGSSPNRLTNVNGTLFFTANDGTHGLQLWESNGSATGTFLVKDIISGFSPSGYPYYLTNVNGTLFFSADDAAHGDELWASNGTAEGTVLVADIVPGSTNSLPQYLTNVNGTVFFMANDGTHGRELWESNGSAAGTFLVQDINPGAANGYALRLTNGNGTLFFEANDGTHGFELWASNGTAAGTFLVGDINPGSASSFPYYPANVNGALFFGADDGTHGNEPWILPQPVPRSPAVSSSPNPSGFGEAVTFTASLTNGLGPPPTGSVDFKEGNTDLTPGGVSLIAGQATFSISSLGVGSHTITALYSGDSNFPARQGDDSANPQLVTTAKLLLDINPVSVNSNPSSFTQVNNLTFFAASDLTNGAELWASNGSAAGTFLVKDINPGSANSYPKYLTNLNGTLFFQADDGTHGTELWASNGTAAGTFLVDDINPGMSGSGPKYLTNVNGTLFFSANDGTHGIELWESNGTAAGTLLVEDIWPNAGNGYPRRLTNVNGTLFFTANDGADGTELWESNGTVAGTFMVQDINPGMSGSYPIDLANVNGTVFFNANDGTHGEELWASDGSAAGTLLVKDIWPGTTGSSPRYLTNLNGILFFAAGDGTHGRELWRSDGSAAGTFMVKDISVPNGGNPEFYSSSPQNLTNVNGTLFFSAFRFFDGRELWKSSGSAAGTSLVKNIRPDPDVFHPAQSSYPGALTNVNGTLFFEANDGTHGIELWESTGSTAGTFLVRDINPRVGSYTGGLTNGNGILFFSANDDIHGTEPWIVVNTATTTSVSSTPNPTVVGQAASFTATVSAVMPELPAPTGTVDFKEGSTDLTPGGVTVVGGQATFSTTALGVGSHTITAVYSGDSSFKGSQGDDSPNPQVVQKDSTSVTLLTSPSTLVSGQPVAFAAVVANASGPFGTPTGQVQFSVDGTNLGSPVTLVGGVAPSLPTKLLAAGGPHTITATYTNSDGNFLGSSKSVTQAVAKDGTKTFVTSLPTSSVFGQIVVFIATVNAAAPGRGTVTGTVDFKEGATDLTPGGVTFSAGRATFSTSSLGLGNHTITASYSGDANFTGSSGDDASAPEVVRQASTRTVMTSFPDPSVFGQAVSFTVAVLALAPSQGTPTGTVAFTDGATTIGSVTLSNTGRATFTTASLSRGNHAINANYGGDIHFLTSAYSNFGETVQKDASTSTVTPSVNPAVVGTTVTFTAAVQASSPGAGKATGTVVFKDITTVLATLTLNNAGQATFTISTLALGNHAITATYQGDNNFASSVSALLTETVKSMTTLGSALALSAVGPLAADPVPAPKLLLDINPGSTGSFPGDFTQVNNLTFFTADDGTHGTELWESNGSAAGTFMVKDINPGTSSSNGYPHLTNVNGTLFFTANDGTSSQELWRSNGTAAGTFLVSDINPGATNSYPSYLTNVNGTLFFSTDDGTHGDELWESNGSAAGTFMVKDINPGSASSYPYLLANMNGTLFFETSNGSHEELWESNGSAAGTFLVKDFNTREGMGSTYPANVNGTLFFTANDGTHGSELWESNGSAAGTFLLKDINPGPGGSIPLDLTNVNGTLFFSVNDGTHGDGLWESNGSAAGTFLVQDINPGVTGSVPYRVTNVNGELFFGANDGTHGSEPWILLGPATTTVTLLISPSTLVSGQSVEFVAVVTNTSGPSTPTGQVQFAVDGTNVGSPVTLVGGAALSLPTRLSATGSPHTITATYTNSDGSFVGSSKSVTQAVAKDGTNTFVSSIPTSSVFGQIVAFTATANAAAPGRGIPTGTVDFKEGATDLTPGGVTMASGRATFSTSSLGLGNHTITATYGGDANFIGSSGNDASAPEVVRQASTRTVMTSFPDPAVFGQGVSFTVAVIALAPSQGTPTGTVSFTDGTTTIGSATLNGVGRATFTTASLSRGNHAINANYGGDIHFLTSAYSNFGETVQKDASTTTVTASANPAVVGTTVTFTATVQASSPGAGTASGTVVFKDFSTALATLTLNGAGQATFTTSALALGTHALTATYSGDTNFLAGVSAILAETVKSNVMAVTLSAALDLSAMRPAVLVSQAAKSPSMPPSPRAEATLLQSGGAAPAMSDASRLDRYFAAVGTYSAVRRPGQLAAQRDDFADWLDDALLPK